MSITCDGQLFTNNVDEFGETVAIKTVSKAFNNRWGDSTNTDTTYEGKKAIVWTITADDKYNTEGIFHEGDVLFLFDNSNEALAIIGSLVRYNAKWYRITETKPTTIGSTTYVIECTTKRI